MSKISGFFNGLVVTIGKEGYQQHLIQYLYHKLLFRLLKIN